MRVLVTGGAGYIGSHAALRLLEDGHAVTIVDDLSRGHRAAVEILRPFGDLQFIECDHGDRPRVAALLRERDIELVMHFGAKAYVGESVEMPLVYYRNNAAGALSLIEAIDEAGVRRLVFSSTCAVYGEPDERMIPIPETCPRHPVNPYGRSKLHVEHMLEDYALLKRDRGEDFAYAALRYFNVAGSDPDGRIGEDHRPETHLIPICLEAALDQREAVTIFGTDYDTPDGTCIRDYVHADDLIEAHVAAMHALEPGDARTCNVGIGRGHSVREVIDACRRVTGVEFPVAEGARRSGDPPMLFADPTKIATELEWRARYAELEPMIETAWRWRKANPDGY
jgi:UDP-glucose 4-epimerase